MNSTVVIVVVSILLVLVYLLRDKLFSGANDESDAASMPVVERTFLALYFVALAALLVYTLLTLYTADFTEPQLAAVQVPDLTKDKPADGRVTIKAIDPQMLIPTAAQPQQLKVYGQNFTKTSTIRLNKIELATTANDATILTAPIQQTDYLGFPSVSIDVIDASDRSKPTSNAVRLPIYSQSAEFRWMQRTWVISREVQLLLLVICAGALGSYLHAIQSLTDYIGNRQLTASWFWFYVTRPFLGMALAIVFYAAIRGGFVAGSPADAKSVNPFGVVAIAALVGMFADTATQKLKEIFNTLFKTSDTRLDKLAPIAISTTSLPDATHGTPYTVTLVGTGGKQPYTWSQQGLPADLALDPATGVITGTPKAAGTNTVGITVADAAGAKTSKNLTMKVA